MAGTKNSDLNEEVIRDMQRRLRRVGYSCPVTGIFDTPSTRSLKAFQRDLRLSPSGELDRRSDDVLRRCADNMTQVVK